MNLLNIFYSIQKLDRMIRLPRFLSTAPFSTMQKLHMVLVSAINRFQPLLQPEMTRIQSKKDDLQRSIKKFVDDIQEIESTLESKKIQLVQLRTDLETLVVNEEIETSSFNMDQTVKEIKARLIKEITGSSASASSSAEPMSDRCRISRNGLIGINSAFENCLRSAETLDDFDESSCWTLLKEIGISHEKIGKIEAKMVRFGKKDPLKSMMVSWIENLSVSEMIYELDELVDAEEASRLVLSLEMISKGLKIVRLPRWMMIMAVPKSDDETQPENLFELCVDDSGQQECDRIMALMERAGVFSKDAAAKDEIAKQIKINSISPTQLLMRIDELVPHFPVKPITKAPISTFLKTQRQQMLDELNEHLKRLKSPKDSLDAETNHICLFVPSLSSSSSTESAMTRLKYLATSAGFTASLPEEELETREGRGGGGGGGRGIDTSTDALQIFEKVRLLILELESILQVDQVDPRPIVTATTAIVEAKKAILLSSEVFWGKLDQFFNSIFEAKEKPRPEKLCSLKECTKITKFNLEKLKIQSIAAEIGQLTNLQSLCLWGNQLTSIPTEIGQLMNLRDLYLHKNLLTSIAAEIGQLMNLQTLSLYQNQLTSIPIEIGQLMNLQTLSLSSNYLTSIPIEIGQLMNLQTLSLSSNYLTSIPIEIGQLTNLKSLFLHQNQLTSIPTEIGQLMNLQSLCLFQNQLTSIPAEIGQLTNLQSLQLHKNQLTSIPAEIGQLTKLTSLYLGYCSGGNQLSSLPEEISQLINLQTLDLRYHPNLRAEFRNRSHTLFSNLKNLRCYEA